MGGMLQWLEISGIQDSWVLRPDLSLPFKSTETTGLLQQEERPHPLWTPSLYVTLSKFLHFPMLYAGLVRDPGKGISFLPFWKQETEEFHLTSKLNS